MLPKAIFFDVFGTLLDMSPIPREQIGEYVAETRRSIWRPLSFPGNWYALDLFDDVRDGLTELAKQFDLFTLSNAQREFQQGVLLAKHDLTMFTDLISLAKIRTYKPKLAAYGHACDFVGLHPSECLMVSGNKGYEQCEKIGLPLCEIRHPGGPQTLIELAAGFNM